MAGSTNIGWTNKTWNPVRGCERVSEGCRNCYAEVMAARHSYHGGWGHEVAHYVMRPGGVREPRWTGVIEIAKPKTIEAPLHWRDPCRVFVNSMSDLFHDRVPFNVVDNVFDVMARCQQHTFQILTKRPARMLEYSQLREKRGLPVLPNVWQGVSAEDGDTFDERVTILQHVRTAVRWVSAEPLLGYINAAAALPNKLWNGIPAWNEGELQWVVIGGESGSDRRPMDIDAARSLIEQCKGAGVPVFVKQDNGPRPGMQGRFTAEEWAMKDYPA